MKVVLPIVAILVVSLVSGGSDALPLKPYVGLFTDANHSMFCYFGVGSFDLYVWWLPSVNGSMGTVYDLVFPPNVVVSSVTTSPAVAPLIGCDCGNLGGYCAMFTNCQSDWVWSQRIGCIVLDETSSVIEIKPCEVESVLSVANCSYLAEDVTTLNLLCINWCWDAIDEYTWGAIKSLYR
jgi:hypothetical protein